MRSSARTLTTPTPATTAGTTRSAGRLWAIMLAAVLWGTVGVTTQTLYRLTATNPLSVGFFRLALATPALALSGWALLGRAAFRIARRDAVRMLLIGLMLAQYQACFFAAIPRVGVAVATLVTLCLAPVLVALLSTVILRERPTPRTAISLACALAGIGLIVGAGPARSAQSAQAGADLGGILLACGAALGYAIVTLVGRTVAGRYHPAQINTVAFASGALALLPLALATGFVAAYPARGWLLLLYLGLVPSALAYALFISGMRTTPATVASIATLLEPLTATALAWLLFGERLGPLSLLGAALLLGAMAVLALGREAPPQPAP